MLLFGIVHHILNGVHNLTGTAPILAENISKWVRGKEQPQPDLKVSACKTDEQTKENRDYEHLPSDYRSSCCISTNCKCWECRRYSNCIWAMCKKKQLQKGPPKVTSLQHRECARMWSSRFWLISLVRIHLMYDQNDYHGLKSAVETRFIIRTAQRSIRNEWQVSITVAMCSQFLIVMATNSLQTQGMLTASRRLDRIS